MKSHFDKYNIVNYDIETVLRETVGNYRNNSNSYFFTCPDCGRVDKFYIQRKLKYFTCFVCGIKGGLYGLLSKLKGISYKEAFELVNGVKNERVSYEDLSIEKLFPEIEEDKDLGIIELPYNYKSIFEFPECHEVWEYLNNRGINKEMMEYFDIRYCAPEYRLIFPIYFNGSCLGYQARDITGVAVPKIKTSPGLQKSKILYNYDNVIDSESVVITEGPVDCMKAYKNNSVALLGKDLSLYQLNLLLNIPTLKKVYIGIDPEERELREELFLQLSSFWETFLIPIQNGKDIGDCSLLEVEELIKNSNSVFSLSTELKYNWE